MSILVVLLFGFSLCLVWWCLIICLVYGTKFGEIKDWYWYIVNIASEHGLTSHLYADDTEPNVKLCDKNL